MSLSPIEKRTEIFFCERKVLGKGIGAIMEMKVN